MPMRAVNNLPILQCDFVISAWTKTEGCSGN